MEKLSSNPPLLGKGGFPPTRASTDARMRRLQVHYDSGGEITDDGYPNRQHDVVMEKLSQGFWRTDNHSVCSAEIGNHPDTFPLPGDTGL